MTVHPAQPIAELPLSHQARRVCQELGVQTVRDLLARHKRDFLAVRGCGERTWAELSRVARAARPRSPTVSRPPRDPETFLGRLNNPRAEKALVALGISTLEEFFATTKEKLLSTRGFGERTYQSVLGQVKALGAERSRNLAMLPAQLLQLSTRQLGLMPEHLHTLSDLGLSTVGEVLAWPPECWNAAGPNFAAGEAFRAGLERQLRAGLEPVTIPSVEESAESLTQTLMRAVPEDLRDHLRRRLGWGVSPVLLSEVAESSGQDLRSVLKTERKIRRILAERAPRTLARLRGEILQELEAFEGVVTGDHLAAGTLAHGMAKETGSLLLPLRMAAFCFPRDLHLHKGCLVSLPSATFDRLLERLRELTAPDRLPVIMAQLVQDLTEIVDPVPAGLLQYLVEHVCRLTVQIQRHGEVITRRADSVASRLHRILLEAGQSVALLNLLFEYRGHHRHARRDRLLTHLRRDRLFLEVGRDLWSLREWHQEELEMAFTEANRAAEVIVFLGGRHEVETLLRGDTSERGLYLVIDCLRRDRRVRHLGRGDFCTAISSRSVILEDLTRDFRRAMGEIPLARYLANVRPRRRRLVGKLVRLNRLFVEPAPDRIDLLSNYPFDAERLESLRRVVSEGLSKRGGYAVATRLLPEIDEAGLGGSWLTQHMLIDLLGRHGGFELLPGGLVAQTSLGLGGWILSRARDAIRAAATALTADEVAVEVPELAQFAGGLRALLAQDPMLQTADGVSFCPA